MTGYIFAILVVSCLLIACCVGNMLEERNSDDLKGFSLIGTVACLGIIILCLMMLDNKAPQAMDVYKGNTTLEYTIVDGVPVDSVVVFKKK